MSKKQPRKIAGPFLNNVFIFSVFKFFSFYVFKFLSFSVFMFFNFYVFMFI